MKKIALSAQKRTVFGKKVKKLRKEGLVPATVYGKDIESVSVQVTLKDFEHTYKEAGETGVVSLTIEGDKERPVLIKNVHQDPLSEKLLHTDFYQVNLKEKVTAMIPIEAVGEANGVTEKIGTLINPMSEIEVEALPTELPEKIEVDVTHLAAVGDQILVSDLKVPSDVEVKTDLGQVVFKLDELAAPEPEPEPEVVEGEEGVTPAEGEEAAEGEKTEESSEEAKEESSEEKKEE